MEAEHPTGRSDLTGMVERLGRLGLSGDEAKAYLTMVIAGTPLDSRDIAENSGVAPSAVDGILAGLVARGAVVQDRIGAANRAGFAPLAPEALLARLAADFEASVAELRDELPRLGAPAQTFQSYNLDDKQAVLERAAVLIRAARRGIWAAIWPADMPELAPLLDEARRADVDVTVLLGADRTGFSEASFWHRSDQHDSVLGHLGYRLLVLIADNNQAVIAGFHGSHTWGSFTDNPAVVLLAVEYVRNNLGTPSSGESASISPDDVGGTRRRGLA
jgi:sugar-specific transcriptional regulator TrmB